jgi:hypothetical protein
MQAVKRRKNTAHGVSRGERCSKKNESPGGAKETVLKGGGLHPRHNEHQKKWGFSPRERLGRNDHKGFFGNVMKEL